jgi:D-alanyl-D-alanine carboxypeptidase/D-alanyl-D-alanine-endopeptidase (penicillin-binding protein 4)
MSLFTSNIQSDDSTLKAMRIETFSLRNDSKRVVLFLCLLFLLDPVATLARQKGPPPLAQQIEQLLSSSSISIGFLGIEVYSIDRKQIVFERNAGHLFVPASNTKIFTTATALAKLPADFRYHTTLESSGRIDKYGRLNGDLILVGRGDPNLSNRPLPYDPQAPRSGPPLSAIENLVNQLVARGVTMIEGDIVGDDSFYVNEPYGDSWGWDDLIWSYGAAVSALTLNDNVFSISISPGEAIGDRAFLTMDPFYPAIKLRNDLVTTTAGSERRIHIERSPGSPLLHLWGTIPLDAKPYQESIAVGEPARFAAESLCDSLRSKGVHVYGEVRVRHLELWDLSPTLGPRSPENPQRPALAEIVSHPLREDLKIIAKVSQNLHAEMLLRQVGAQLKGEGSVRAGLQVEREFLKEAGVDDQQFFFGDGSGMDPHNLVAPHAVVQLLNYLWSQPYRETFIDLLPVGGIDGTLSSRFKGTSLVEKVFAKTGTLTHVNALSGYATSPRGEHFIFSILTNNHQQESKVATATMDKILETILTYREPSSKKSRKK